MLASLARRLVGRAAPAHQARGFAALSGWGAALPSRLMRPLSAPRPTALPAMLQRAPLGALVPPVLLGGSRHISHRGGKRDPSVKLRHKRMGHPARSKRDALRRIGRTPAVRMPDHKWGIHARDEVMVYRGKRWVGKGKVLKVSHKTNRVWVEGINLHEYPTADSLQDPDPARYVEYEPREKSVHYSQCNLIDPADGRRTRLRFRYLLDGRRVRVAVRSGAIIPRVPYVPVEPREKPVWSDVMTTSREHVMERTNIPPDWAKRREVSKEVAS